jgi:hypothetical protein
MCVLTNRLHSLQADSTCGDSLCRVCSFLLPFSRLVILQGCLKSIFHNPGTNISLSRPLRCFSLWYSSFWLKHCCTYQVCA